MTEQKGRAFMKTRHEDSQPRAESWRPTTPRKQKGTFKAASTLWDQGHPRPHIWLDGAPSETVENLDFLHENPASPVTMRLDQLRRMLRPTPHVPLAVEGMHLFAKLEYVNPVGSIKDRPAFWILKRAAERGVICDGTTVIESSSGNFASALAAYTRLAGLRFIPVIDPNISGTYESFLRRLCPSVVKVEHRDDTGGFLKTRLDMVKHLCATIPNAYWTNQCGTPAAGEAHYQLTAGEICPEFDSLDYVFIGVSTGGTIAGMSRRLKERYPNVRIIAVDAQGSAIFGDPPPKPHIPG